MITRVRLRNEVIPPNKLEADKLTTFDRTNGDEIEQRGPWIDVRNVRKWGDSWLSVPESNVVYVIHEKDSKK